MWGACCVVIADTTTAGKDMWCYCHGHCLSDQASPFHEERWNSHHWRSSSTWGDSWTTACSAGWLTKLVLSKSAENDKIGEPFAELGWSHFISLKAGKVIELMAALEISDGLLLVWFSWSSPLVVSGPLSESSLLFLETWFPEWALE